MLTTTTCGFCKTRITHREDLSRLACPRCKTILFTTSVKDRDEYHTDDPRYAKRGRAELFK